MRGERALRRDEVIGQHRDRKLPGLLADLVQDTEGREHVRPLVGLRAARGAAHDARQLALRGRWRHFTGSPSCGFFSPGSSHQRGSALRAAASSASKRMTAPLGKSMRAGSTPASAAATPLSCGS